MKADKQILADQVTDTLQDGAHDTDGTDGGSYDDETKQAFIDDFSAIAVAMDVAVPAALIDVYATHTVLTMDDFGDCLLDRGRHAPNAPLEYSHADIHLASIVGATEAAQTCGSALLHVDGEQTIDASMPLDMSEPVLDFVEGRALASAYEHSAEDLCPCGAFEIDGRVLHSSLCKHGSSMANVIAFRLRKKLS